MQHECPVWQRCWCRDRHTPWRPRLGGRGPEFYGNRFQGLPVLCLLDLVRHPFQVPLCCSTLREEFLHFHETMLRLARLLKVYLGIVVEREAWIKRDRDQRLLGTIIIDNCDTRCPTRPTLCDQQSPVALIRQVALQFAAVLSEIGHFAMQFMQSLPDRLLHRAAEVGEHGVPQTWLGQRCDGVLSAGNGRDGAGTMRQRQGTEVFGAL